MLAGFLPDFVSENIDPQIWTDIHSSLTNAQFNLPFDD